MKQIYSNGLKRAVEYLGNAEELRTEKYYYEWKNRLMENEPLISNDYSLIDPMWCDYAEKRLYAGQFMLQLKAFYPEYENKLNELWNIFGRNINSLMYEYIAKVDLTPGSDYENINIDKLNNEIIRKEMCEIVNKCEIEERKAARIITKSIWIYNYLQKDIQEFDEQFIYFQRMSEIIQRRHKLYMVISLR